MRYLVIFLGLFGASLSLATPTIYGNFQKTYPDTTVGNTFQCMVCHSPPYPSRQNLNPYGLDVSKAKGDFKSIEKVDSDKDGFSNIDEINGGTNPGDPDSHASYKTN